MQLVDVQDGKERKKKGGEIEVIDDSGFDEPQ